MSVSVIEYTTKKYRSRTTGARVHAPFPPGYVNEVNYDGSIKAFLLSNECNVSHAKIKKLISEMTDGEVEISVGMINGLCAEFSLKTEPEKKKIIGKLMSSPVMNADFTNANVNGKSAQVLEEKYDAILATAEKEYADNPPSDYYREGYNLFLRLRKYKENELLFLHDKKYRQTTRYVKGLQGYSRENRNRQLLCEAKIVSDISVMDSA